MTMNNLVRGSIGALDQLIEFIAGLDDRSYNHVASPVFESSIGQHLRHILDIYLVLMHAEAGQLIDYDKRRRGHPVETVHAVGLSELEAVKHWLQGLTDAQLSEAVVVKSEVDVSAQHCSVLDSSLGRELCFAASHQIHHMAIMAAVAKLAGLAVDDSIGLAPATASYAREQGQTATWAEAQGA